MVLMELHAYYSALPAEERAELANACKTTVGHLQNIAYGLRKASATLAVAIERATSGAVTRRDLRPDDWHLIWPELATPTKEAADA